MLAVVVAGCAAVAVAGCTSNPPSGRGAIIAQWSPAGQAACDKAGIVRVRATDSLGAAEAACADGQLTVDANAGLNSLSLVGLDANGEVIASAPARTLLVVSGGVQPSGVMSLLPGTGDLSTGDAGSDDAAADAASGDADAAGDSGDASADASADADADDGFVTLKITWNLDSDPGSSASCFVHGVQTVRMLLYSPLDPGGVDAPLLSQDVACALGSGSWKVPPGTYGLGLEALDANGGVVLLVNGAMAPSQVTAPGNSVFSLVKPHGNAQLQWSIVDQNYNPIDCGDAGVDNISAQLSASGSTTQATAFSCGTGSGTYDWPNLDANKYQLVVSATSKYGDTYATNPTSDAFEIKAMDSLNVSLQAVIRKVKSGANGTLAVTWTLNGQAPTTALCGNANVQLTLTDTQQNFILNASTSCIAGKKSLTVSPGMRVLQMTINGLPNGASGQVDDTTVEVMPGTLTPQPLDVLAQ